MLTTLISLWLVAIADFAIGLAIGYVIGLRRGLLSAIRTFKTSIQEGYWSREEIDDLVNSIIDDWRGPRGERYYGPVTYGWKNNNN